MAKILQIQAPLLQVQLGHLQSVMSTMNAPRPPPAVVSLNSVVAAMTGDAALLKALPAVKITIVAAHMITPFVTFVQAPVQL